MANVSSCYLLYMDPRGVKLFHDFGLVFFFCGYSKDFVHSLPGNLGEMIQFDYIFF